MVRSPAWTASTAAHRGSSDTERGAASSSIVVRGVAGNSTRGAGPPSQDEVHAGGGGPRPPPQVQIQAQLPGGLGDQGRDGPPRLGGYRPLLDQKVQRRPPGAPALIHALALQDMACRRAPRQAPWMTGGTSSP